MDVNGEVLMQNGIPVQAVGTPGKDGMLPSSGLRTREVSGR